MLAKYSLLKTLAYLHFLFVPLEGQIYKSKYWHFCDTPTECKEKDSVSTLSTLKQYRKKTYKHYVVSVNAAISSHYRGII